MQIIMTYQEFNLKYAQEYGVFLSINGNDFTDNVFVSEESTVDDIVVQYFGENGCFTSSPLRIDVSYVKDLLSCFINNDKVEEVINILYKLKQHHLIKNDLID